jgi:integrase
MVYDYCKACKCRAERCLLPDSHRAQNRIVWCCDFTLGGKRIPGSRKQFKPGVTKKEAEKYEHCTIADFERGQFIPMDKGKTLFGVIVDRYFDEYLITTNRTQVPTRTYYKKTIKALLGHMGVGAIKLEHLEQARTKFLQMSDAENAGANRLFSFVKAVLNRGIEWGYIPFSPAKFLRPLPVEETKPRFLSEVELQKVWAQFRKDRRVDDYATAIGHTAIRPIDIKSMEWNQVNREHKTITVTTWKGKQPRTCVFPIDEVLWPVIERRYKETGGMGKVFDTAFRHQLVDDMIKDSGVNEDKEARYHFTIYGLKHCYISYLLMSGASLFDVSKLVHVSVVTLEKRYGHLTQQHLRNVQSKVSIRPTQQLHVV